MSRIDRTEVNRALAKCLAYKDAGKDDLAYAWAAILIQTLECHDVLHMAYSRDGHRLIEMVEDREAGYPAGWCVVET